MREPMDEKNRINVRWGWFLLWLPFLPWVFGEAEGAGLMLAMLAGGLLFGHVVTAMIDARNDRRKERPGNISASEQSLPPLRMHPVRRTICICLALAGIIGGAWLFGHAW